MKIRLPNHLLNSRHSRIALGFVRTSGCGDISDMCAEGKVGGKFSLWRNAGTGRIEIDVAGNDGCKRRQQVGLDRLGNRYCRQLRLTGVFGFGEGGPACAWATLCAHAAVSW